jgi:hypothetical protein
MAASNKDEVVEGKVIALAEQIGWFLGTVQNKAEGWLDRDALNKQVTRIRDGASELLKHINNAREATVNAGATKAAASVKNAAPRPSRGPVDAPGKKHRKPPPQEKVDRRMGEPVGKKMGQKNLKNARRGRG